jgi:rod shape-determining protein MreC
MRLRILVAGLWLLALLLFISNTKPEANRNPLDRLLVAVSAPIQKALVWAVDGLGRLWSGYVFLVGVEDENERLRRERLQMDLLRAERDQLAMENQRLRLLVDLRSDLESPSVRGARVIAFGSSPAARSVRLDVGAADGVRTGDAVVCAEGLVGRIGRVEAHVADVQLVSDARFVLDVIIGAQRSRALLKGQGEDDRCVLEYVRRTDPVTVGDEVISSGLTEGVPAGLKVGTLHHLSTPSVGLFRAAEMAPAVDFGRLEEVLVLLRPAAGERAPGGAP